VKRALAPAKVNYCERVDTLGYEIEGAGNFSRIRWTGPLPGIDADGLDPMVTSTEERSAIGEAVEFVSAELADGPLASVSLEKKVTAHGISGATYRRARLRLGVTANRVGEAWYSMLPEGHSQGAQRQMSTLEMSTLEAEETKGLSSDDGVRCSSTRKEHLSPYQLEIVQSEGST